MTPTELKQVILGYIRELYNREYIGQLDVTALDPTGYKVSFNFAKANNPLVIISDLSDEEFLPFIKKELRNKKLHSTEYYKITKLQPSSKNICYER